MFTLLFITTILKFLYFFFKHSLKEFEKEKRKNLFEKSYTLLERLSEENYKELIQNIFPKIEEVLNNMSYSPGFLKEYRKNYRICSADFFDIYFRLSIDETEISKTQMEYYLNTSNNEEEFEKTIKDLIQYNKIHQFLDRIEDYKETLNDTQIKTICNTLINLGDLIPKEKTLFSSSSKEAKIYYLILNLLSKKEEYLIIKEAIEKSSQSIDIPLFIGLRKIKELENSKIEEKTELINELKNLLKEKIEHWTNKYNFKDDKISSITLYKWKEIDEEGLKKYLNEKLKDTEELLYFLTVFIIPIYSQTLGEYAIKINQKLQYKSIKDFIDYEFIEKIIRNIDLSNYDDKIKFAVKEFLDYFDGKEEEDKLI